MASRGKAASGRTLFELRADLFVDDEDAAEDYVRDESGVDVYDVEVSGTSIALRKVDRGEGEDEGQGEGEGEGEAEDDGAEGAESGEEGDVPVVEELFLEDDVELPDDIE